MTSPAKAAALQNGAGRSIKSDGFNRRDRDAYMIGVLRALDERIDLVSASIAVLSGSKSERTHAVSAERQELGRRLADLRTARQNLVAVVFRS